MRVALYRIVEDGDGDERLELIYKGDVEGLPPGPAREYWEEVKRYHGANAEEYLRWKAPPMALIYRGYSLEVLDEDQEEEEEAAP